MRAAKRTAVGFVAILEVPLTAASVPDAVPVKLKDAVPAPLATSLQKAGSSSDDYLWRSGTAYLSDLARFGVAAAGGSDDPFAGKHTKRSRRIARGGICNVTALLLARFATVASASMRMAVMPDGTSYSWTISHGIGITASSGQHHITRVRFLCATIWPEVTNRPDFTHKRTNHELRRPCERYRAQP
jgi:hypothetical protein